MKNKNKDKSYEAAFSRELYVVEPPGPWPDPPEKYVPWRKENEKAASSEKNETSKSRMQWLKRIFGF